MHDKDLEIILIVPGIIAVPSLQEYRVNHSKENIHDQAGNLYKTIFYVKVQRRPAGLRASCNNSYITTKKSGLC